MYSALEGSELSLKLFNILDADITEAISRACDSDNEEYFPTNKQRMQFIRNQVKRYKKMLRDE